MQLLFQNRIGIDCKMVNSAGEIFCRSLLQALHEVSHEAKLLGEHRLTEVALKCTVVAMTTAMQYVCAVLRENDITLLTPVELALLDENVYNEARVDVVLYDVAEQLSKMFHCGTTPVIRSRLPFF